MLLALSALVLVAVTTVWVVVALSRMVMLRLGVEPMTFLLWVGLAEWPNEQPRSQRPRLGQLYVEPPSLALRQLAGD